MKNSVIIKGNKYGICIVLNDEVEFSKLLEDLEVKLENAEEFFDCEKQLAVTFEGRSLSNEELDSILAIIENNSKLNIQYVMDDNSELEATFFDIIQAAKDDEKEESEPELIGITNLPDFEKEAGQDSNEPKPDSKKEENTGMFYRGTLRSGQALETKSSLVIVGDVNPGASVVAGGNIVIIGTLKGSVTAGCNGDKSAFVIAMGMEPIQIKIADVIARSSDKKDNIKAPKEAMLATIVKEQICIAPLSKTTIHDILF
ncbi:MAG: septum site-determining protein MinC [Lachnospiraceae bacterium]|nr:septum site-determining protein MinC [Lachnospiraceae bacterium]